MWHESPTTRVTSFENSTGNLPISPCLLPITKKTAPAWRARLLSPSDWNSHADARIAFQKARHTVEEIAEAKPLAYIRFQERYSLVDQWLREFDSSSRLRLYLNPIRIWTTLPSFATEHEAVPPTQVLFFAHRDTVRCLTMDLEDQALVNELADFQPCTFMDWSEVSHFADSDRLMEISRNLANLGLVAFG